MKPALFLLWLLLTVGLFLPCPSVHAQATKPAATSGDQWISHQMNQPPPDTSDKSALSPEMMEEIRQLYVQAKKEHESKTPLQSKDKKDTNHKPVKDTGKK
jgi:hypothetical protein